MATASGNHHHTTSDTGHGTTHHAATASVTTTTNLLRLFQYTPSDQIAKLMKQREQQIENEKHRSKGDMLREAALCGDYDLVVSMLLSKNSTEEQQQQQHQHSASTAGAADHGSTHATTTGGKGTVHNAAVDINESDGYGNTALMFAAQAGFTPIVQELLQRGADANRLDKYGQSALALAAAKGHWTICEMLVNTGKARANGNHSTATKRDLQNGRTVLMKAVYGHHQHTMEIVRFLVEKARADIHTIARDGRTALIVAAEGNNIHAARYLAEMGADLDVRTIPQGHTALMRAADAELFEMCTLLVEMGADTKVADANGNTLSNMKLANPSKKTRQLLKEAINKGRAIRAGTWVEPQRELSPAELLFTKLEDRASGNDGSNPKENTARKAAGGMCESAQRADAARLQTKNVRAARIAHFEAQRAALTKEAIKTERQARAPLGAVAGPAMATTKRLRNNATKMSGAAVKVSNPAPASSTKPKGKKNVRAASAAAQAKTPTGLARGGGRLLKKKGKASGSVAPMVASTPSRTVRRGAARSSGGTVSRKPSSASKDRAPLSSTTINTKKRINDRGSSAGVKSKHRTAPMSTAVPKRTTEERQQAAKERRIRLEQEKRARSKQAWGEVKK